MPGLYADSSRALRRLNERAGRRSVPTGQYPPAVLVVLPRWSLDSLYEYLRRRMLPYRVKCCDLRVPDPPLLCT